MGDCPYYESLMPIPDSVPSSSDISYARATLPVNLEIRESKIAGAGLGVFSKEHVRLGGMYGPYQGVVVSKHIDKDKVDTSYMWQVHSFFI